MSRRIQRAPTAAGRGHRGGVRHQPAVHHVPGGLPDEVVLHKLLVLVQPRLHPGKLDIVADADGGPRTGSGTLQQLQVAAVAVVMVVMVVTAVVQQQVVLLLMVAAADCGGRLLAVDVVVAAAVEWWQGDTRTRAQRSIEPHCAPLLGGHPALRLFYTAQVQACKKKQINRRGEALIKIQTELVRRVEL